MTFINVTIGFLCGAIALIPLFFVQRNAAKGFIAVVAILVAFLGHQLSQTYVYPRYLLWRFESSLQNQEVFALIAQYHPAEYQQFMQKIKTQFKNTTDIGLVAGLSVELLKNVFDQHLEKAPTTTIDIYLKSTMELYQYLFKKMPAAIVFMETGRQDSQLNFTELAEDATYSTLLNHVLEAKKLIIKESIKTPVETINRPNAEAQLDKIFTSLSQKFGPEIVKGALLPTESAIPPRVAALVIMEYYSEIIGSGQDNAADIMRFIASKNYEASKKKKP